MQTVKTAQTAQIKLPEFSIVKLIKNASSECLCDACNRKIKNVYVIKNNKNNEILNLGSNCVKKYSGKTVEEIKKENIEYENNENLRNKIISEENTRKENIRSFTELNEDMYKFIAENQNNSFLRSIKRRIEETGTVTKNIYNTIYSMMLEEAELEEKVKNLEFKVIKMSKKEGPYGFSYTLLGETKGKLIRIFFSSINSKHKELLVNNKIMDNDEMIFDNVFERNVFLKVQGVYDGYKIKRAKLSAL